MKNIKPILFIAFSLMGAELFARIQFPSMGQVAGHAQAFGKQIMEHELQNALEHVAAVEQQARAGLYNAIYQGLEVQECGGVGQCGLFGKMKVQSKYYVFTTLLDRVSAQDIAVVGQYAYKYGVDHAQEFLLDAISNIEMMSIIEAMKDRLR